MKDSIMAAKLKELYLPPVENFTMVDVPEMRFIMIDGKGAADRTALNHATKWLFAVIDPLKPIARERMGKNFVAPPLEALWWADDIQDFKSGKREKLNWRMMIVYEPDWLTTAMFDDAVAKAKSKLGEPPNSLRLESYPEGLSAQIMYVGPPSAVGPTIARLHDDFLPSQKMIPNGHHHEIYLVDPTQVPPHEVKTVIRQPVRSAG